MDSRRPGFRFPTVGAVFLCIVVGGVSASAAMRPDRASLRVHGAVVPLAVEAPRTAAVADTSSLTDCTLPDTATVDGLHCYTPQQIRAAYGVDSVARLSDGQPNYGQGQTIVLVDSYGSPTATADLQHFHDTFFPGLPNPNFQQVFPNGNPQFHNTCKNSKGQSGPCSAAGWSGEATLDIEWAYAIAPEAHLILLAVP